MLGNSLPKDPFMFFKREKPNILEQDQNNFFAPKWQSWETTCSQHYTWLNLLDLIHVYFEDWEWQGTQIEIIKMDNSHPK